MHKDEHSLSQTFSSLFGALKAADYAWTAPAPEHLRRLRQNPEIFGAMTRFFGLGDKVAIEDLLLEGLPPRLIDEVLPLHPAISRHQDFFVAHGHWGASRGDRSDGVYLGPESFDLLRWIEPSFPRMAGKSVLDLGSGSGLLSFAAAPWASAVLGIEASGASVRWAEAARAAQEFGNVHFREAKIGSPLADQAALQLTSGRKSWDFAVFNPPMALPRPDQSRPGRDGGALGIEIPLLFLAFAHRHLSPQGEVYCLATNPIVRGRPAFFDAIAELPWRILSKNRLHDRFNADLYRKDRYADAGIERVELWCLHLRKRESY